MKLAGNVARSVRKLRLKRHRYSSNRSGVMASRARFRENVN